MNAIGSIQNQTLQPLQTLPLPSGLDPRARAVVPRLPVNSIQEVNSMQQAADKAVEKLATGGNVSPAEVLTAVQKADIAFHLMMQVRNKLVQAFEDVQKISV